MQTIVIDYGVHSSFKFTLTSEHFVGTSEIVFVIKNKLTDQENVVERRYNKEGTYIEVITPEESKKIQKGAIYGFGKVLTNGDCFNFTPNGGIDLNRGVFQCQH